MGDILWIEDVATPPYFTNFRVDMFDFVDPFTR
jgi:hypothetical protein